MKTNHNKKRNTAFLFEALIRELTKASLKNNQKRKNQITNIIIEFFKKDRPLLKELELYKLLYETKDASLHDAERILDEVKRVYSTFEPKSIFNAQSKLISKINKELGPAVFSNFVPNYKSIASVFQIFNKNVPIKTKMILERSIVNTMTQQSYKLQKEGPEINNTTLKMFAKRFNSTYNDLLSEQRNLLSCYINSFKDNGLELKMFLNEEIGRLRTQFQEAQQKEKIKSNNELSKKLKKVLEVLNSYKEKMITTTILKQILEMQQVVREINEDE